MGKGYPPVALTFVSKGDTSRDGRWALLQPEGGVTEEVIDRWSAGWLGSSAAEIRAGHAIAAGATGGRDGEGLASDGQAFLGLEVDPSYLGFRIVSAWSLYRRFLVVHPGPPCPELQFLSHRLGEERRSLLFVPDSLDLRLGVPIL